MKVGRWWEGKEGRGCDGKGRAGWWWVGFLSVLLDEFLQRREK
jgi:hypothetical protein